MTNTRTRNDVNDSEFDAVASQYPRLWDRKSPFAANTLYYLALSVIGRPGFPPNADGYRAACEFASEDSQPVD